MARQKSGYFHRVTEMSPTRLWINNVTPKEARLALEAGAVGCTQNPTYSHKMLTHPEDSARCYSVLDGIIKTEKNDNRAQGLLQYTLVKEIAEQFLPLYRASRGRLGFVTIQADPFHEQEDTIVEWARFYTREYPNIMAKIPAIPAGFAAMEKLLAGGCPILATEVMSVSQMLDCAELYERFLEKAQKPPVMYFAHIPGIFDEYITSVVKRDSIEIPVDYVWQGGIVVAKKIGALLTENRFAIGFCSGGARGLHHFTEMVGASCSITINWGGSADKLIELDQPVVQRFQAPIPPSVTDTLCERIPEFRKAYESKGLKPDDYECFGPVALFRSNFEACWRKTLDLIAARRKEKDLY
jgi:transaldolase